MVITGGAWTKFEEPQPEVQGQEDPVYWHNTGKFHKWERTKLQPAKRARDLAPFPAGKALTDTDNHGHSVTNPGYWWSKKKYYEAEPRKLREEFWGRWKRTSLQGGKAPLDLHEGREPLLRIHIPPSRSQVHGSHQRTWRLTRSTTQR